MVAVMNQQNEIKTLPRLATPPESGCAMPVQDLGRAPRVRFAAAGLRTTAARVLSFGGALALTWFGADQMTRVFDPANVSALQIILRALFVLTFGWIAFAATSALAGLLFGPRRPAPARSGPLRARTAILMPVYNEDPASTAAALLAMARGIEATGHGGAFEIFILSDTRDPAIWAKETRCFAALRTAIGTGVAVWYRRRTTNTGRKAGNVGEFVQRWGGRYAYMLVLDADSLMAPATIVEMVRRMDADPRLGILQTVPMLAFGATLFARLQQFAGRVYGPTIARGVAAWQGQDGNYWGHNALIRVRAFADSAGLPELKGRKPFGGHVLSHDFVEAALMRRAGWNVRMDPDLDGSWEGAPPSLIDAAARDRRWAQGNLQHVKVIGASGLRWPNRVHFAIGIGSYLASPVWLLMILVGLVLTAQAVVFRPEYFPDTFQLFPAWPRFDAERMRWLFVGAMGVLLFPKALGLIMAMADSRVRRGAGGGARLLISGAAEIVLSALYAPVLMLMQCRQVAEILSGRDSGWNAQTRNGGRMAWREAWRRHWRHFAAGVLVTGALGYGAPPLLLWLAPVLVGLWLAPALSWISGNQRVGKALARMKLLVTSDELFPAPIATEAWRARAEMAEASRGDLIDLARDPVARARHVATLEAPAAGGRVDLTRITARAKIAAAGSAEQALGWLDERERIALLSNSELLEAWARRDATGPALIRA